MIIRTVIKVLHCIVTASLLVMVVMFFWIDHQDSSPDELKSVTQINGDRWLYMTERDNGGATVPITYRYYIHSKMSGSDQEVVKQLSQLEPLISGMGNITDIQSDKDNRINVSYSGRVIALSSDANRLTFQLLP